MKAFNEFKEELNHKLKERGYNVREQKVNKINEELHSLIITEKDSKAKTTIEPTFYYDYLYELYEDKSIDEIADYIIDLRNSHKGTDLAFNVKEFRYFENIKDDIYCAFANKELNKELLKEIPYVDFCDLAIIFKVRVVDNNACITITNNCLNEWNVTIDDLVKCVFENKHKLESNNMLLDMQEFMYKLTKAEMDIKEIDNVEIDNDFSIEPCGIYVFSNNERLDGASMIYTHKECLKNLATERNCDLLILPSSRHEVLIHEISDITDFDYMRDMVQSINQDNVSDKDFLSDNIYIYNKENDTITIY